MASVVTPAAATPVPAQDHISLGVPAGDAYSPTGLAVDAGRKLAYVYNTRRGTADPGTGAAISVVNLERRAVSRLIPVSAGYGSDRGQLLLSPDGNTGYVVDQNKNTLTVFDPATGDIGPRLEDVREAALSEDGRLLFVIGNEQRLSALRAADLAAQWEVTTKHFTGLAVNGDGVAALSAAGGQKELSVYGAADGKLRASVPLGDHARELAVGPSGGWAVRLGSSPAHLLRFGSALGRLADATVPGGDGLFYDAPRHRYLVGGGVSDPVYHTLLSALAEDDLTLLGQANWTWQHAPTLFAAYGDQILGFERNSDAHLTYLDPQSLLPVGRAILGVTLESMALDDANQVLYVADNQDRIHVLDLPGGEVRATWPGRAGMSLDPANGRLYVNRPEGVVALDTRTGQVLAQYPQAGVPAPDPGRDYVYIARDGISYYSRTGQALGRLGSTFPSEDGSYASPYAFNVRVNPFNGSVAAGMNNNVPGSNNASYLQLYPPATDRPADVPGRLSYVVDLIYDPATGRAFAAYSSFKNVAAVQALDATGREVARLNGREGALALDPAAGSLYVAQSGTIARMDAGTLDLQAIYNAPARVSQVLLNRKTGQLYYRNEASSSITSARLDALQAPDTRPQPVPKLPKEALSGLWAAPGPSAQGLCGCMRCLGQTCTARVQLHRPQPHRPMNFGGKSCRWARLAVTVT
jgi:hypothetical protein